MMERFTDRARKVMSLANQQAQAMNHKYVGAEHILLGLVKEGSGVAANVLKNMDVSLDKIRAEVERIVKPDDGFDRVVLGKLPLTPCSIKVVKRAVLEADALTHNYVGTEHLLIALLREREGVAVQVLAHLGVKPEAVVEEVLNLLGFPKPEAKIPYAGVVFKSQLTYELDDHQILLHFDKSTRDALLFYDWWLEEGQFGFRKWLDIKDEEK